MAYISVDHGSKTANGNYLVNWKTKPPEGKGAAVSASLTPRSMFSSLRPPTGPAGQRREISPEKALRICKDQAANHLRTRSHGGPHGRTRQGLSGRQLRHPLGREGSGRGWRTGSCIIASDGKVREFRFDKPLPSPGGPPGTLVVWHIYVCDPFCSTWNKHRLSLNRDRILLRGNTVGDHLQVAWRRFPCWPGCQRWV